MSEPIREFMGRWLEAARQGEGVETARREAVWGWIVAPNCQDHLLFCGQHALHPLTISIGAGILPAIMDAVYETLTIDAGRHGSQQRGSQDRPQA